MATTFTGDEHFTFEDMPVNLLLSDFWKWSTSNLSNTALLKDLAEYIVSSAIGCDARSDEPHYLECNGHKIHVSASGYVEEKANRLRSPSFSTCEDADCHIFCLLEHLNRETVNPLHLEQWTFFILPTSSVEGQLPVALTVNAVKRLSPITVKYDEIKQTMDGLWAK